MLITLTPWSQDRVTLLVYGTPIEKYWLVGLSFYRKKSPSLQIEITWSDLQQVGGSHQVLWFPPPKKLMGTI